ncbi:MAG: formyltransferase family protein [Bacteroidia bacterium]|nr:formyltransferase family protein [Bacteroidia bacterium]
MARIVLHLLTTKGLSVLQALVGAGHQQRISAIEVGRDANNHADGAEEVFALAKAHRLVAVERGQLPDGVDEGYHFAVGWRWLLPTVPNHRLIVFHDSPLPRYRGFAPLPNMLIMGERELGVTALLGGKEYDTGAIVSQATIPISYPCTIEQAIGFVAPLYAQVALDVVAKLDSGTLKGNPQVEEEATYSLWRDEWDYWLDFEEPSEVLERTVDACGFPYAGARCSMNGQEAIVVRSKALPDVVVRPRVPGKVIRVEDGCPVVVCGTGLLRIEQLLDAKTHESLLPLARFRSRFGGLPTQWTLNA